MTATSQAGRSDRAEGCGHEGSAGFTLLELVVVLVILALAAGLLVPRLGGGGAVSAKQQALATAGLLRAARADAVSGARETLVLVDLDRHRLQRQGAEAGLDYDPGIPVTAEAANAESRSSRVLGIRFFPNGGSTGGKVWVGADPHRLLVSIDWLTGRVSVEEAAR